MALASHSRDDEDEAVVVGASSASLLPREERAARLPSPGSESVAISWARLVSRNPPSLPSSGLHSGAGPLALRSHPE